MKPLHCSLLGKILVLLLLLAPAVHSIKNAAPEKQKKIIIFTSKGGNGHMSACALLQSIFKDQYDIKLVNPLEEILGSMDFVKKVSFGSYDGEQFYNMLMQNGWNKTINNILVPLGMNRMHNNRNKIARKFYNFLEKDKPDLLLSLIPLLNLPASKAAERLNIPFMLMNLDLDLYTWLMDMDKCTHPNYAVTVVQKTPLITKQLEAAKIPASRVKEIGFQVRKDFFDKKDKIKICKEWNLPMNKPLIMIMMGGVGSSQTVVYTKELLKLDVPAHLMVCFGKNYAQEKILKSLKTNDNVTMTLIPFTTKASDLMFVSDLFITKPGPNSFFEAMSFNYKKGPNGEIPLPTLVNGVSTALFWELDPLVDLLKETNIGAVIRKKKDIRPIVKEYLGKPRAPKVVNPAAADHFEKSIKQVVYDLFKAQPVVTAQPPLAQK